MGVEEIRMRTFTHGDCEWYVNDTRGYIDAGPACDECGACECKNEEHGCPAPHDCAECGDKYSNGKYECVGLSVAYVNLDGGEALCTECAEKAGLPV
jgi:hypothetical protein